MAVTRTKVLLAAKALPSGETQSADDDVKGIFEGIDMVFQTFDNIAEAVANQHPDFSGEVVGYSITVTELTKADLQ